MALTVEATFVPDPAHPARGGIVAYHLRSDPSDPPAAPGPPAAAETAAVGLPAGTPATATLALPVDGCPRVAEVAVRAIPLGQALPALLRADAASDAPASLRAWARAARIAVDVVRHRAIAPALAPGDGGVARGVWRSLDARELLAPVAAALPPSAHAVARDRGAVWDPLELLVAFADAVADLAVRDGGPPPRQGRPRARLLPWTARWAEALADPDDPGVPLRDEAEELAAGVSSWLAPESAGADTGVTQLTLSTPAREADPWPLAFGLRTADGVLLPAGEVWERHDPSAPGLAEALLSGLGACAQAFPPIDRALQAPAPEGVELTLEEAWTLAREARERILDAGAVVVVPDEIDRDEIAVRARVEADDAEADDALLDWEVAVGDEPVSPEELDRILASGRPLVRWRDRWLRVDPERRDLLTRREPATRLPLLEALALGLAGTSRLPGDGDTAAGEEAAVVAGGAVADLLDRVRGASEAPPVPETPPGFSGQLRPYQRRGVAWLSGMGALGFGAVLADEMGLGKTPELIAHLLGRDDGGRPSLVVCPTSVVGNWERELHRFAPGLPVTRHHGPEREGDLRDREGVVLTTYGVLRRDVEVLAAVDWDVVALDEAQQVKNPATAGARAVRELRSRQTVALTGTPLENRLAELWSLLDATNPGLLGSRARFGRRFAAPIEQHGDAEAARTLRRIVAPFVLRREKADVVADLPPKIERVVACPLTSEQAELYQRLVAEALPDETSLSASTTMERRGRILALLTSLKQVCNHPVQYLEARGESGGSALSGRSGKLAVAREIVGEAVAGGEQVLVFTQYVAMGRLLVAQLADDLGTTVPFLHGGVSAPERDRIVAGFQGENGDGPDAGHGGPGDPGRGRPPVLVVSLRAGGTGLNLTAATHVVHYDRWWNPAVEDQATDRAHRIGQHRTVEVHKLVTAGTVEERVAELLERKRALASTVVAAGEAWITELSDAEIAELVALSDDAPVDDLDDDDAWLAPLREAG